MATRPSELPRWATSGATVTEPAEAKKDIGWITLEKPPFDFFNWLLLRGYEWDKFQDERLLPLIDDNGVLLPGVVDNAAISTDAKSAIKLATDIFPVVAGGGLVDHELVTDLGFTAGEAEDARFVVTTVFCTVAPGDSARLMVGTDGTTAGNVMIALYASLNGVTTTIFGGTILLPVFLNGSGDPVVRVEQTWSGAGASAFELTAHGVIK